MKRIKFLAIFALAVISFFYSCKPEEVEEPIDNPVVVDNLDITTNTTWTSDNDYNIDGIVSIKEGAILTIEPGTKIQFGPDGRIDIGYYDNATFIAIGTEDEPIVFTSSHIAPTAGAWEGIFFWDFTQSNSAMKYCEIEYAGANNNYAITMTDCKISFDNCTIRKSGNGGIKNEGYSEGGFVSFTNNKFENLNNYAVSIYSNDVHTLGTGNIYDVDETKGIEIHGNNYSQTTNKTWLDQGIPYYVTDIIYIDGNLTIAPGCEFKFDADKSFNIGYNQNTTLIAEGTADNKITFTSSHASPTAGSWEGLLFWDNTQASTSMKYCDILYAGKSDENGAIEITNSKMNIQNCSIAFSNGYGIYAPDCKGFTTPFQNNIISDCANHVMAVNFKYTSTLGTGNVYNAAENTGIKLCHEDYTSTTNQIWLPQAVPYYLDNIFYITGNLTIADACVFKLSSGNILNIGYDANTTLTANNVTFTSSAANPNPGDWEGIKSWENAQNINLTNCTFSYGGSEDGIFWITESSINLDGSTISNSENWGIYLEYNGSYTGNVTFIDNASGDVYDVNE